MPERERNFTQLGMENTQDNTTKKDLQFAKISTQQTQILQHVKLEVSISPQEIYDKFLKYFQSVDKFFAQTNQSAYKSTYQVKTKLFGQITLNLSKHNQNILLSQDNTYIYYANLQNNHWHEKQNRLSLEQIKQIKKLPQTQSEIAKEYSAKYLTRLLASKLREAQTRQKIIKWKFNDENQSPSFYTFKVFQVSKQKPISILGTNESNSSIFEAKIYNNGVIDIIKNLIFWQSINSLIDQQLEAKDKFF